MCSKQLGEKKKYNLKMDYEGRHTYYAKSMEKRVNEDVEDNEFDYMTCIEISSKICCMVVCALIVLTIFVIIVGVIFCDCNFLWDE